MVLHFREYEFDGVLWDLDNTLVRVTEEYPARVVSRALRHFGLEVPPNFTKRFWHEGGRSELVETVLGINPDIFWPVFNEADDEEERDDATIVYDDVPETLYVLQTLVKQGIVTASPLEKAMKSVQKLDSTYFGSIVSASGLADIPTKPHPYGLQRCMEELRLSPERTLYVGDSATDILAARNAGVTGCLIDRGEFVVRVKPDLRVRSLYELVQ